MSTFRPLALMLAATAMCVLLVLGVVDKVRVSNALQPSENANGSATGNLENADTIRMQFVLIKAGEFSMGDSEQSDNPTHAVKLTKSFYLATNVVSNAQYRKFRASHDSGEHGSRSLNADDQPAVMVSWADATAFCEFLSARDKKTYRLPTEAEWEYACRAGRSNGDSKYPWGKDFPPPSKVGNYCDATAKQAFGFSGIEGYDDGYAVTSPIGKFPANGFGLFDMAGNVWQWCSDYYDAESCKTDASDPQGPSSGSSRVLRGASWHDSNRADLRSACRYYSPPTTRNHYIGFRVVLVP